MIQRSEKLTVTAQPTWSFFRRKTNGVIIFFALETRSCASILTLESPLTLKIKRRDAIASANCPGWMKFIKDYEKVKSGYKQCTGKTYHELLQIILQRRASE